MPIRPALETLRVLDNENFMDKLALAIHDVSNSVRALGKAGKITVDLTVAPLSKSGLVEPVITIEAEINAKPPKPDASKSIFFFDEDGNTTTNQQRQRGLDLTIAADVAQKEQSSNG